MDFSANQQLGKSVYILANVMKLKLNLNCFCLSFHVYYQRKMM